MKKPVILIIITIIALLAFRVVWVAIDEPDNEYPLIARPYNLYTGTTDSED